MGDRGWVRRVGLRHLLVASAVVFSVVGAVGSLRTGDLPGNGDSWVLAIAAISYAVLGWMVTARRPELAIGWLFLAGGVLSAASFLSSWWAVESLVGDPGSLPGGAVAAWLSVWLAAAPFPLVLIAPLILFPVGRARSRRWWWFLAVFAGLIAVLVLASAVLALPAAFDRAVALLDLPGVAHGNADAAIGAQATARMLGFVGTLVGLVGLVVARRTVHGTARRPYTTVLIGAAVMVGVFVITALIPAVTSQRHAAPEALASLALLAIPIAIAVAVVRFHLYELRAALSRSVLIIGVGAVLAAVYLAVLAVLAAVLNDASALSVPSALAAGAVVVVSAPVAAATSRRVRRLFGRGGPDIVASRFSDGFASETDASSAISILAGALREELRLGFVELRIVGFPPCQLGEPDTTPIDVGLCFAQREIGVISVSPRPGETLGAADVRLLRDVSNYIAVAAEAIRNSEDLRQAQHALERAHVEERRRVRRDLHDGVGPALASICLKLAAHRRHLPEGLSVDDILEQVTSTISEVRRVVEGLQPSILEDLGLVPALQILVADVRQSANLVVALDVPVAMPELSADAAGTAYRVVAEALSNVVRHSRASRCEVRIEHLDGELRIEVCDNGRGFDIGDAAGTGLRSIASRATLAHGAATIASTPGAGTTITLRVPA